MTTPYLRNPDEDRELTEKHASASYSLLTDLGLDDADYQMLCQISGEILSLRDTQVSACLDPEIATDSDPDGYQTLVRIARMLAINGYAQEPARMPAQLSETLAALLNSGTRQLLIDALNFLDYVIGWYEEQAKELSLHPTEADFVLVDEARAVVLLLMVQASRVTREIRWLLMGGFPDAAWARWRTLHELAVTSAVIVDSEDADMPTRYLARAAATKARLVRVSHAHGFLTNSDKDDYERELADYSVVSEKDDYAWAAGQQSGRRHSGGFASLEQRAGLDSFRPFYVIANSSIHAGAASLYRTRPGGGAPLINGAVSSHFYLPVHLTLRSLRILLSAVLLGTARSVDGERVIALMDYFEAVICSAELVKHCEKLFGRFEDALGD